MKYIDNFLVLPLGKFEQRYFFGYKTKEYFGKSVFFYEAGWKNEIALSSNAINEAFKELEGLEAKRIEKSKQFIFERELNMSMQELLINSEFKMRFRGVIDVHNKKYRGQLLNNENRCYFIGGYQKKLVLSEERLEKVSYNELMIKYNNLEKAVEINQRIVKKDAEKAIIFSKKIKRFAHIKKRGFFYGFQLYESVKKDGVKVNEVEFKELMEQKVEERLPVMFHVLRLIKKK